MGDMSCNAMNSILGNVSLRARLWRDASTHSLSHAYIIEGEEGSGRSSLALLTAAACSCSAGVGAVPCGECPSCRKILERKSPDVIFINSGGKATLGVDVARFIKEDVVVMPNDLDDKFYIIEDADKMTPQAQNAILLTLEEPPSFVHFFLLCKNAELLLETIRSRAPILRTEPIDRCDIDKYLIEHDHRAKELSERSPLEYAELLSAASGSIGRAIDLLEPKEWATVSEQRHFVRDFIGTVLCKRDGKEIFGFLMALSQKRDVFFERISLISLALRDLILLKKSDEPELCFYSSLDEAIELCDKVSMKNLLLLYNAVNNAVDENKRNGNLKLLVMKLAVKAEII